MCRLRARHGAVGGRSACAGASVALHRVGGMEGTGWILQLLPGSSTLLRPSRTSRQRGLLLAQGRSPCSVRSAPNPRHTHSRGAGGLSPVASLPGRGIVPSCRCCLGWGTRVSAAPGFALKAPAQPYHPRWPPQGAASPTSVLGSCPCLPPRAGRVPWAGRAAGRASGSDRAAGKIQATLCTRGIRGALGAFGLSCTAGSVAFVLLIWDFLCLPSLCPPLTPLAVKEVPIGCLVIPCRSRLAA